MWSNDPKFDSCHLEHTHYKIVQWTNTKIHDFVLSFESKYLFTVISFLQKNCTIMLKCTGLVIERRENAKI